MLTAVGGNLAGADSYFCVVHGPGGNSSSKVFETQKEAREHACKLCGEPSCQIKVCSKYDPEKSWQTLLGSFGPCHK